MNALDFQLLVDRAVAPCCTSCVVYRAPPFALGVLSPALIVFICFFFLFSFVLNKFGIDVVTAVLVVVRRRLVDRDK